MAFTRTRHYFFEMQLRDKITTPLSIVGNWRTYMLSNSTTILVPRNATVILRLHILFAGKYKIKSKKWSYSTVKNVTTINCHESVVRESLQAVSPKLSWTTWEQITVTANKTFPEEMKGVQKNIRATTDRRRILEVHGLLTLQGRYQLGFRLLGIFIGFSVVIYIHCVSMCGMIKLNPQPA